MKKNIILIGMIFIVIAAGILVLLFFSRENAKLFYRVEPDNLIRDNKYFRVDNALRRIYFKKGNQETQLEEIPSINGHYFFLRGKKQIKMTPGLTGDIGFYTYLCLESHPQTHSIHFTLEINRKGKSEKIAQITTSKASHPFFKDLAVKKGDLLLLKFKGRGIVYLSQPIMYKKFQGKDISKGKHIFFIAADTLRGDQIGMKVNSRSITPNMDQFLGDAVYLENAYAQTSWTLPSFMSLFTGLYEFNHEVGIKDALHPSKPFLVQALSQEFITFAFHGGKVMNSRWGFSRGFDYYKKFQPAAALYPRGGQSLFQKAIELLEKAQFPGLFLFLHTYQVHAPYTPPKNFLYQINKHPKHLKLEAPNFNQPAKTYLPVEEEQKHSLKELYQAEILAFDAYFGEFIQRLKAMNIYDNAMIILMSDHGEEFYEHKGWTHSHSLYDELIRVPVFIKFPHSQFKNTCIKKLVGIIDLFPTILSYYNIPPGAAKIDGIDLMPLIKGKKSADSRDYVISTISTGKYFEAFPSRIAICFGDYKLIYNEPYTQEDLESFKEYALPPQIPKFELYNLKEDPVETRNIIDTHTKTKDNMMPVILKIRKLIRQKAAKTGKKTIDEEVRKQLESLGYL
ncbi:MAG: sulfatase-like hydrolase/transferase [Candidatus Aminicenantes bacterium]|nr:MAG: sulfatase-like hydrolase/transferase [Candidatus Aminicenantes bacterium]